MGRLGCILASSRTPGKPKTQYVLRFLLTFQIVPRSVNHVPRGSNKTPRSLKRAPRGHQEAPQRAQEGPKMAPRNPKTTPTPAQDGPPVTQEPPRSPKMPPRGPKTPLRHPKSTPRMPQEPVMSGPRSLKRPNKGSAEWRKPLNHCSTAMRPWGSIVGEKIGHVSDSATLL